MSEKILIKEKEYEPIPYHGEDSMNQNPPVSVIERICHDCGVGYGENHKENCDMERCPLCGKQLISCGHL